jgi:pyrrolidone-carboxylate peptidase
MQNRTFVTGYGPFKGIENNPTTVLARTSGRPHRVLEVTFDAVESFLGEIDPESFDRLVLLGVADGRPAITPELFARNYIGKESDVSGRVRRGPIDEQSPLLLEGTLWPVPMLADLAVRHPCRASLDAGSYLCNYAYYRALQKFPGKKVGFLHVPSVDAVPLERQQAVLQEILRALESE